MIGIFRRFAYIAKSTTHVREWSGYYRCFKVLSRYVFAFHPPNAYGRNRSSAAVITEDTLWKPVCVCVCVSARARAGVCALYARMGPACPNCERNISKHSLNRRDSIYVPCWMTAQIDIMVQAVAKIDTRMRKTASIPCLHLL